MARHPARDPDEGVAVRSARKGEGSPDARGLEGTASTSAPRRTRLLTIEDEGAVRRSIVAYFEDGGFEVDQAENGEDGLARFRSNPPDVVLTDLRMAGPHGLDVVAAIAKESPDTPVIVVSGAGVLGDAIRALRLGAWDYVTKPISDMAILEHVVHKALERSRLIRENRRYQEHLEDEVRQRTAALEAANAELAETRLQIIWRLGKAAEYRDSETGHHVIRVSQYCHVLATGLNLDRKTAELIYLTSPLHDLGKIGIPDSILRKPGSLDCHEWEVMRQHCPMGAGILKPLTPEELGQYREHTLIGHCILEDRSTPLLQTAADIAASHHEWWDGSGYPRGLKGEEIPLAARIVALADIYDALASRRPYKDAFSPSLCEKIIREAAGTHLDPKVVDVFLHSSAAFAEIRDRWPD